jgi:hypothetical protein
VPVPDFGQPTSHAVQAVKKVKSKFALKHLTVQPKPSVASTLGLRPLVCASQAVGLGPKLSKDAKPTQTAAAANLVAWSSKIDWAFAATKIARRTRKHLLVVVRKATARMQRIRCAVKIHGRSLRSRDRAKLLVVKTRSM